MPQFDQFSFYNQVSSFLLFFFLFYFLITYFFLPKICYNMKLRKKKIVVEIKKKNQIFFEKNNIIFFFNNSYKTFCSKFEIFFSKKTNIYNLIKINQIKAKALINKNLKKKSNIVLNRKFLFIKKIFVNI